ncbi:hypothetical protein SAMN02745127_01794 [Oceanospirillum multiglobuliferum]|uniref:Outer membrane protein beta-barrel domain-containing protein n=1 Tax=Oceanospirillum multiglobuliferum TaxID=64969 RepID=A0A1T4Q9Y1_9GAMM|nr:hypothetical protein [Oceanospirillum multiglobuliferum]OPX56564.1 hypothetical protein BTE48_03840 [Oceanospirillum multiglobuliferum]SKA00446.1 hypothetical protein SAMN02745127_01794 [Oceanospirillum multiglobuliferum]
MYHHVKPFAQAQSFNRLIALLALPTISLCSASVLAAERAPSYLELGYLISDLELAGQQYSGSGVRVKGAMALNTRLRLVGHYDAVGFDSSNDLSRKDFGLGADYRFGLGAGIALGARYEYVRSQVSSTSTVSANGNFFAGELLWDLPDWAINLGSKRQLELYAGHTRYTDTNVNEFGGELRVYINDSFSVGLAYQQEQPNKGSNLMISIREER